MNTADIPLYRQKQRTPVPPASQDHLEDLPFVIIGSGPAGLVSALDLAKKGHDVVLLTAFDFISEGSKGICYAKQSLDVFNRLGVGETLIKRGVNWNIVRFSGG